MTGDNFDFGQGATAASSHAASLEYGGGEAFGPPPQNHVVGFFGWGGFLNDSVLQTLIGGRFDGLGEPNGSSTKIADKVADFFDGLLPFSAQPVLPLSADGGAGSHPPIGPQVDFGDGQHPVALPLATSDHAAGWMF